MGDANVGDKDGMYYDAEESLEDENIDDNRNNVTEVEGFLLTLGLEPKTF